MRKVLIFLAVCAFTAAMVPKEKRALNTEEEQPSSVTVASSTKPNNATEICQPYTPCAWSIYNPVTKVIESFITNGYCICSADTVCLINENDVSASAYVHRCRAPGSEIDIETR